MWSKEPWPLQSMTKSPVTISGGTSSSRHIVRIRSDKNPSTKDPRTPRLAAGPSNWCQRKTTILCTWACTQSTAHNNTGIEVIGHDMMDHPGAPHEDSMPSMSGEEGGEAADSMPGQVSNEVVKPVAREETAGLFDNDNAHTGNRWSERPCPYRATCRRTLRWWLEVDTARPALVVGGCLGCLKTSPQQGGRRIAYGVTGFTQSKVMRCFSNKLNF